MSDLFDRASAREAELLSDTLADQRRRAGLDGKTVADSALTCVDCDEPIPERRRTAYPGVQLCVDCKTRQERIERNACVRY
ncbi:MAG TPA: TraR/DksA family transcriptional regulator [Accumulibacter sp.]|uniref:TraR/DksA family transcriptional regulator n=1 Tax=Accumulibacter sp. TaxID=2053492 RepID=UPI002BBC7973|nr:TraR/DksA family transcriptional regulator [Accumulibacter sp.]HRD86802.1 TraR/DksA family transcriptional regulator [Accumulibacter sp.]